MKAAFPGRGEEQELSISAIKWKEQKFSKWVKKIGK